MGELTLTISIGNGKLGKVANWSTPAGIACPGASEWCAKKCYAKKGFFLLQKSRYGANLLATQEPPWVDEMVVRIRKAVAKQPVKAFRIHVGGDMYSAEYIQKWIAVITQLPDIAFWGYTRSWTQPELINGLEALRDLPNMQLFASWDDTMPPPPKGWRLATISANGYACPEQTGRKADCASCGYCFFGQKHNVAFKPH